MFLKVQRLTPECEGVGTVDVIIDALDSCDLLHAPDNRKRRIAWVTPYLERSAMDLPTSENLVCLLLRSDNVQDALEAFPTSLGLLVLERDERFSPDVELDPNIMKRLIVVRKREHSPTTMEIQSLLHTMLFELYRWNERCEEIANWSGSLQELVDASVALFTNWIDISDATYTLIAHVRDMEPPDTLSKNLVELGCHSTMQVDEARNQGVFMEWRDQAGIGVFEPTDLVPFQHVTYVIKIGKVYYGHVVMVCNNAPLTPGLIDLFEVFARHCEKILTGSRAGASDRSPYEGFLTHLLEGSTPSQDYIENQKMITGIEDTNTFCVAVVDNSDGAYSEQTLLLLSTAKGMFSGAFSMLHDDALLVLFYAPDFNPDIIVQQLAELDQFCERFDSYAYRSGTISAIEDLALAYQQALAARKYRFAIESGLVAGREDSNSPRVFKFVDAFCYLTCDFAAGADTLMAFSAENSHLDLIERLQLDHDVSDLKVLYRFLFNERKATPTAEQLHMHRNNVLYRIGSIEKRYHLDLNDFFTRQYLLACFRIKINGSAKFRKQLL